MFTGEGVAEEGVYVTEHAPDERVHMEEMGENVPAPVLDQLTLPVGEEPDTVATHVVVELTATEGEEQATEVALTCIWAWAARARRTNDKRRAPRTRSTAIARRKSRRLAMRDATWETRTD